MPVNTRYLKGPYKTASSLYKAALSATNKVEQINDAEQKFLFDTRQISGQDYLDYATKRASQYDPTNSSQILDSISWQRTIDTTQRAIRSDYRANKMLEMSLEPDNNSTKAMDKVKMYSDLYDMAAKDGDQQQMVALATQYNNAVATYQNKLESEAKSGSSAAFKTYTEAIKEATQILNTKETYLKQDKMWDENTGQTTDITDPMSKVLLNAGIASNRAQLADAMGQAVNAYKPEDQATVMNYQNQTLKYQTVAKQFEDMIGKNPDGTIQMTADEWGQTHIKPAADTYIDVQNNKVINKKTNTSYSIAPDANGDFQTTQGDVVGQDYYFDANTGEAFKLSTPQDSSIVNGYRVNPQTGVSEYVGNQNNPSTTDIQADPSLDNRMFTRKINGQDIPFLLNGGTPITVNSNHQSMLTELALHNKQADYAVNAGLIAPEQRNNPAALTAIADKLPTWNFANGQFDVPKVVSAPYAMPTAPASAQINNQRALTPQFEKTFGLPPVSTSVPNVSLPKVTTTPKPTGLAAVGQLASNVGHAAVNAASSVWNGIKNIFHW